MQKSFEALRATLVLISRDRWVWSVAALLVATWMLLSSGPGQTEFELLNLTWAAGALLLVGIAVSACDRPRDPETKRRSLIPRYSAFAWCGVALGVVSVLIAALAAISFGNFDYNPPLAWFLELNLIALVFFAIRWTFGFLAFCINFLLQSIPPLKKLAPFSTQTSLFALAVAGFLLLGLSFAIQDSANIFLYFLVVFGPMLLRPNFIAAPPGPIPVIFLLPICWFVSFFMLLLSPYSGDALLTIAGAAIPDVFSSGDDTLNGLLWVSIFSVLAVSAKTLRQSLVAAPSDGTKTSSLSIYPDPRSYVSDDGYFERLTQLVRQSNGGVIGVTGVRGAGKSALLGAVFEEFDREHCVVWTVAPVSYQSEDKLSFLMSVSRTICQKAIDDAQAVLYGRRNEVHRALEEFVKSVRVPLLLLSAALGAGLYYNTGGTTASNLFNRQLDAPENVTIGDDQVWTPFSYRSEIAASYDQVVSSERAVIGHLISELDEVLPEGVDLEATPNYAVLPVPGHRGFDLISGKPDEIAPSAILARFKWIRDGFDIEADTSLRHPDFRALGPTVTSRGIYPLFAIEPVGSFDEDKLRNHLILTEQFFRQTIGRKTVAVVHDWGGGILTTDHFEATYEGMTLLRGDARVALQLEGTTSPLRGLMELPDDGAFSNALLRPDLASIILYAAFNDTALALERQVGIISAAQSALDDPLSTDEVRRTAEATRAKAEEEIVTVMQRFFLSPEELVELRGILERYIDVLEGGTLSSVSEPSTAAPNVSLDQNIALIWVVSGLLLFCFLPEIWRGGNFVVRGILNFRLLVLMRECNEFMEMLSYSEGRETSAGFGFRGLSLSGKRALTARNMTLQSLTDRYQEFVFLLLSFYNGKLVVVIDELDKMSEPMHVKSVLLELKGALFQRGCYYLISISEDAASAFRGRLSEGRDIFESTFEDVLTIEHMSPAAARAMVRQRLSGGQLAPDLSDETIDVITAFSGAIPREIVRHLRDTTLEHQSGPPPQPREVGLQIFRHDLKQWIDSLTTAPFAGAEILKMREILLSVDASLLDIGKGTATDTPERKAVPWPEPASEKYGTGFSIGAALLDCLRILDSKNEIATWRVDKSSGEDTAMEEIDFRHLAEVQSCLRQMTLNELMRYLWTGRALSAEQLSAAVACMRAIPLQPAVALELLKELSDVHLGLGSGHQQDVA